MFFYSIITVDWVLEWNVMKYDVDDAAKTSKAFSDSLMVSAIKSLSHACWGEGLFFLSRSWVIICRDWLTEEEITLSADKSVQHPPTVIQLRGSFKKPAFWDFYQNIAILGLLCIWMINLSNVGLNGHQYAVCSPFSFVLLASRQNRFIKIQTIELSLMKRRLVYRVP